MDRSNRIKNLYADIKDSLGSVISSGDALRLASHLIDAADVRIEEPLGSFRDQRISPEEMAVDEAISNVGWQLFFREKDIAHSHFYDEFCGSHSTQRFNELVWS